RASGVTMPLPLSTGKAGVGRSGMGWRRAEAAGAVGVRARRRSATSVLRFFNWFSIALRAVFDWFIHAGVASVLVEYLLTKVSNERVSADTWPVSLHTT